MLNEVNSMTLDELRNLSAKINLKIAQLTAVPLYDMFDTPLKINDLVCYNSSTTYKRKMIVRDTTHNGRVGLSFVGSNIIHCYPKARSVAKLYKQQLPNKE